MRFFRRSTTKSRQASLVVDVMGDGNVDINGAEEYRPRMVQDVSSIVV